MILSPKLALGMAIFILGVMSTGSAYAQDVVGSSAGSDLLNRANTLDNALTPTITATLTGLSLTGASFLINLTRGVSEDSDTAHIRLARRSFIKAFYMFLICTLSLFAFDFLEVFSPGFIIALTILDIIVTYTVFGIGTLYLAKAARELYVTYGK